MGVFDAAVASMRWLDWSQTYGSIDLIREMIEGQDPCLVIHGDGVIVPQHMHDKAGDLLAQMDQAKDLVDQANQICIEVLKAL